MVELERELAAVGHGASDAGALGHGLGGAVEVAERKQGQALTDGPLVDGVDVASVPDVRGERHARRGELLGSEGLGLADERRPPIVAPPVAVGRELDEVERELGLTPARPPVRDHRREQLAVLVGAVAVRLPLVPDRAPDAVGQDRRDHAVVERGGAVLVGALLGGHRGDGADRGASPDAPLTGEVQVRVLEGEAHGGAPVGASLRGEAPRPTGVHGADREDRLPGRDEVRGDLVAPDLSVGAGGQGRGDADAVPEGLIHVVDGGHDELELLGVPVAGDVDGPAVPDDAVVFAHGPRLEVCGQDLGLPAGVVEVRRPERPGPEAAIVHALPEGLNRGRVLAWVVVADALQGGGVIGEAAHHLLAGPRLRPGAPPGGDHQPDGDVETVLQLAGEEVRHGAAAEGVAVRGGPPARVAVLRGALGDRLGNVEEAHPRPVPARGALADRGAPLCVGQDQVQGPLHVRLAGAEPDLSDQHVLDGEGLRSRRDLDPERTARRRGLELRSPLPVITRAGRHRLRVGPGPAEADLLAGVSPTPEGRRRLALEDHAVGEDCREPEVCGRGEGRGRDEEEGGEGKGSEHGGRWGGVEPSP